MVKGYKAGGRAAPPGMKTKAVFHQGVCRIFKIPVCKDDKALSPALENRDGRNL